MVKKHVFPLEALGISHWVFHQCWWPSGGLARGASTRPDLASYYSSDVGVPWRSIQEAMGNLRSPKREWVIWAETEKRMLGRHVSVAKFVLEVAGNLENDTFLLGMMKVSMLFFGNTGIYQPVAKQIFVAPLLTFSPGCMRIWPIFSLMSCNPATKNCSNRGGECHVGVIEWSFKSDMVIHVVGRLMILDFYFPKSI